MAYQHFPNTVTTCWYTLWRYGAKTCQLTSSILILHWKQTALARIGSMLMTLHYSFIVLAGASSILKAHHFEFQYLLEIPAYWWSSIMVIWAPSITCLTCWHSNTDLHIATEHTVACMHMFTTHVCKYVKLDKYSVHLQSMLMVLYYSNTSTCHN